MQNIFRELSPFCCIFEEKSLWIPFFVSKFVEYCRIWERNFQKNEKTAPVKKAQPNSRIIVSSGTVAATSVV